MSTVAGSVEGSVTWPQALAWRMGRQFLDAPAEASVADVVRRLGAVPSMDEGLAELAVGTRRREPRPGDLARALAEGEVVKVFAFRGAVHYLAPDDAGAYLALRCAGRQWELRSWVEHYRLTADDWPGFRAAVGEALDDGPLTVVELGTALDRIPAYRHLAPVFTDDGGGNLIKPLTWQGDVGFGPPRDGRPTLVRPDANPHWRGVWPLDDAGPYAVAAYLSAYGPATPDHLQYWLGNGLSAGRRRIEGWLRGLAPQLAEVHVDAEPHLVLAEHLDDLRATDLLASTSDPEAVRFLPGHDQWVIGPGTKDAHVTPSDRREAITRKANPVLLGGVVAGTWAVHRDRLVVTWLDVAPVPDAALAVETARTAGLLGRPLHHALATPANPRPG